MTFTAIVCCFAQVAQAQLQLFRNVIFGKTGKMVNAKDAANLIPVCSFVLSDCITKEQSVMLVYYGKLFQNSI